MDNNAVYVSIVYLALFRLSIISVGAMSIYLGYKLFVKGIFDNQSENGASLEASLGDTKFALKNAAPGSFFALFGVVVISVMIINSPPEVSYRGTAAQPGDSPSPANSEQISRSNENLSSEWTLRGDDNKNSTELAVELNNFAWDAHDSRKMKEATIYARLAYHLRPTNSEIVDTLAEMLYNEKKYKEALTYKEKAAKLDSKFEKDLDKFKKAIK